MGSEQNLIDTILSLINKKFSDFLSEIASIKSSSERSSRINEFLKVLIEEQKKIEMLENELPLRKLLVNDAIESLKKYKQKNCQDDEKIENGDKEWMISHRLLTKFEPNPRQHLSSQKLKGVIEKKIPVADNPFKSCKSKESGFRGNSAYSNAPGSLTSLLEMPPPPSRQQQEAGHKLERDWTHELHKKFVKVVEKLGGSKEATPKQILALMPGEDLTHNEVMSQLRKYRIHTKRALNAGTSSGSSDSNSGSPTGPLQPNENVEANPNIVEERSDDTKGRNWTYELHTKFVNVVEILGGSEEATPRQILELMQVEELTDNEVMSHLQKYRIHTKRSLGTGTDSGNSGSGPGSPTGPLESNENPNMVEDGLDGAREDGQLERMDGFWN